MNKSAKIRKAQKNRLGGYYGLRVENTYCSNHRHNRSNGSNCLYCTIKLWCIIALELVVYTENRESENKTYNGTRNLLYSNTNICYYSKRYCVDNAVILNLCNTKI